MPDIQKNDLGIHMVTNDQSQEYAVYRIVSEEARIDEEDWTEGDPVFGRTAEQLGLSHEMVETAMEYYYNNVYTVHQDILTVQYLHHRIQMQTAVHGRSVIGSDCPQCDTGSIHPVHSFPNEAGESRMDSVYHQVECDYCDYTVTDKRQQHFIYPTGYRLRATYLSEDWNTELVYEISTRLIDYDEGNFWYVLRNQKYGYTQIETHDELVRAYEPLGDSDTDS